MTLVDVAAATRRGQALAESLMVSTCTVDRQSGMTMDPVTLAETRSWTTIHAGIPCRVRPLAAAALRSATESGAFEFSLAGFTVHLPVGATGINVGDRITVTAVSDVDDQDLLGLVLTAMEDLTRSHAVQRILRCEVVLPQ